ncbi:CHAD domain-containing protein [Aestuariispira insulae]|uniref:CHAD domain-containing protein n=1 Tax=Aestuariispira insulae TaxID=1461337 RepID=A0A3D9H8K4_9PROT|nr:CHAD domain-containing protein [Aestuariispira insulae]RED45799.1 CHAD domain-containing protein [Aestuariispira insulae]
MSRETVSYQLADTDTALDIAKLLAGVGKVETASERSFKLSYYDTFDWRLFDAGKALCVSQHEDQSDIQVESLNADEILASMPGRLKTGFADDFGSGRIRDMVEELIDVRRLMARLDLHALRTAMAVRDKEGKALFRLNLESIEAAKPGSRARKALGVRLVLEPIRGYAKAAEKAMALLDDSYQRKTEDRAPFLKGLDLIKVTPGDYSSKLKLHLEPHMTAQQASHLVHLTLLDTIERNEEGTAANIDAEFLHDFRVAIRRTRSALSQLDKGVLPPKVIAKAKDDFKWIGQQTNDMRDLDVYLLDFPKIQGSISESYRDYLTPFKDYLVSKQGKAHAQVQRLIGSARYRKILNDWRHYLTEGHQKSSRGEDAELPVKELADSRIWKAYRKVMKEGGAIDEDSPAEMLHDLRITCKKLRYLLEFFQSLYPAGEIGKLIKALKSFQNVLGEFQDTEVQSNAILQLGRDMAEAKKAPVETQMAMGMVADSILQKQGGARRAFHVRFDAFSTDEVKDSFKKLFKSRG